MMSNREQIEDWLDNIRTAWHLAGGNRTIQRLIFLDLQRAIRNEPKHIRQAVWRELSDAIKEEFRSYGQEETPQEKRPPQRPEGTGRVLAKRQH